MVSVTSNCRYFITGHMLTCDSGVHISWQAYAVILQKMSISLWLVPWRSVWKWDVIVGCTFVSTDCYCNHLWGILNPLISQPSFDPITTYNHPCLHRRFGGFSVFQKEIIWNAEVFTKKDLDFCFLLLSHINKKSIKLSWLIKST